MPDPSDHAADAQLTPDPIRAAMLMALTDGRARPASELAGMAGVTARAARPHIAALLDAGLIACECTGRHSYYRLAGPQAAQLVNRIAATRPDIALRPKTLGPKRGQLRFCRRCYDHLAGQVGVALTRALLARDHIRPGPDRQFSVTDTGTAWFDSIGMDIAGIRPARRGLAWQCLDWSERVPHLGGPLGVRLMAVGCAHGWLQRPDASRIITVTQAGAAAFHRHLGVDLAALT